MTEKYNWTDNPTVAGVSVYDPDILNDCLMHLKYDVVNNVKNDIESNCQKLADNDFLNITAVGQRNSVSWALPDFTTAVDIPTTLNLVQCCDEDCYILLNVFKEGYGFIQLCDVDGNDIFVDDEFVSVLGGGVVTNGSFSGITPLLKKGTYFKFTYNNAGITVAKKIYRTGVLQK